MKPRPTIIASTAKLAGCVVRDRRGGTAMEYGLILSVVVIVMLVAFLQLAGTTTGMWNTISAKVVAAH